MKESEKIRHLQFLLYLQRQITYSVQFDGDDTTRRIEHIFDAYCKLNNLDDSFTHPEGE